MALEETDVRSRKKDRTRAEIVEAAWELARRDGIASISLRELAARVGMRAPSLYTYFPSKNDLYDAMYRHGMQQFRDAIDATPKGRDARESLANRSRTFARMSLEDPARYELLYHRPIPDFVPSPDALDIGVTGLAETRKLAIEAGMRSEEAFDVYIAMNRGLIAMQLANEPGGDRWARHIDEALEMVVDYYVATDRTKTDRRKR
jgi:AcrR family transcriptional regulator